MSWNFRSVSFFLSKKTPLTIQYLSKKVLLNHPLTIKEVLVINRYVQEMCTFSHRDDEVYFD